MGLLPVIVLDPFLFLLFSNCFHHQKDPFHLHQSFHLHHLYPVWIEPKYLNNYLNNVGIIFGKVSKGIYLYTLFVAGTLQICR